VARHFIRNAGGVPFLTLKGNFVVRARQMPDGDTLSFAATSKYKKGSVETNVPVSVTGEKTVNIRLQSIDAPEKSQPLGAASRNSLLKHFGFDPKSLGLSDDDFTAGGGITKVTGWLATHALDGNGRPLGYLFRSNPGFTHGKEIPAEEVLSVIKSSANYMQASTGWAFPAFYENTDESHAALFKKAAEEARAAGKGVWAVDKTTTGFEPTKEALKPGGALIYPKFYRRVEKWTANKPDARAFINWLKSQSDGKKPVQGAFPYPVPLWRLFEVVSTRKVVVPYDVAKLWFSE
jgi:endonuclease YncB( thermonuclease family)